MQRVRVNSSAGSEVRVRVGYRGYILAGGLFILILLLMQNIWFSENMAVASGSFNVTTTVSSSQNDSDHSQTVTGDLSIYNKNTRSVYAVTTVTLIDPSGKQIGSNTLPGRNFQPATPTSLTTSFTLPASTVKGKYSVNVKLLSSGSDSDSKSIYYTGNNLATLTVYGPSRGVPSLMPAPSNPVQTLNSKLIFGIGSEADGDLNYRLVKEAPVKMLTSWYNRPSDLAWMTGWKNNFVPQTYAKGYSLHLIVYSDDPSGPLNTPYGPACGKPYPLSSRFLGDMTQLAQTFAGNGTVYVTFFSEFQMYSCKNNQWAGSENYFRALKDQYMAALKIFHKYAPNSRVSLGWGGWQSRWDDPAVGGGRSLFPYFADVLKASDFESFQAMQNDTNVNDVLEMTKILGTYGPVMLAHQKPDNGSQTTFENDVRSMLTDSFIAQVTKYGLFAWSFMDDVNISNSASTYQFIKNAVIKYAR